VPRLAPLAPLALCAALLAACGGEDAAECPGEAVATFAFGGTKVDASDPAIAGVDPVPATPDCGTSVGHPAAGEPLPLFEATLSAGPASEAAALCTTRGVVLFGQRTGDRYVVETATSGAVLSACGTSCTAAMRVLVAGDVVRADGAAVAFGGVLVEVMTAQDGAACGPCVLPCAARYALAGTP
jgi:hypothetical protein